MINIYGSLNEWRESTNYMFDKWFHDTKKSIEDWFEDESFNELEFDYFEYDSSNIDPIYIGILFFGESLIEWKMQIIVDGKEFSKDDIIEELSITLDGYDKESNEHIGNIIRTIEPNELISDLIIELISEFKTEYMKNDN